MKVKISFFLMLLIIANCASTKMIDYTKVFENPHVKKVEEIKIDKDCRLKIDNAVRDSLKLDINYPHYYKINDEEKALHFWDRKEIFNKKDKKRCGKEYLVIFNEQYEIKDIFSYKYSE